MTMDSNVKGVHLGSSGQFAARRVHVRGIYLVPSTTGSIAFLDNGVTSFTLPVPGVGSTASSIGISIPVPGRGVLFEGPASAQMGAVTSGLLIWVEGL